MYRFRIYISQKTAASKRLLADVNSMLSARLKDAFTVQVVEVLESPEMVKEDMIRVTPTLVKYSPSPTRKVFGNLRDAGKLCQCMGLPETGCTGKAAIKDPGDAQGRHGL